MTPKPHHVGATGAEHAATFQQRGVAESYRFRPEYPAKMIGLLVKLAGSEEPRSVLDVGCGIGDLARSLASLVERVDAIDISAAMIAEGKILPGGDNTSLNWMHSAVESGEAAPPYSLITGGRGAKASTGWTGRQYFRCLRVC